MIPSAKPFTIENAAAISLSMLLSKVSQISSTASMIAGINVGSASPIPEINDVIMRIAASTSAGRLSTIPCASVVISCTAPSVNCGKAVITPCSSVMTMPDADEISTGKFAASAPPIALTMLMPTCTNCGRLPRIRFAIPPTVSPSTTVILSKSPPASANPDVKSPSRDTPSSASVCSCGSSTVPMTRCAASEPCLRRCTESSNAPNFAIVSSLSTAPIRLASSVNAAMPSLPCAIRGFRSCALLPKSCMASASRSVSFDTFPSASMASQ